MTREEAIRIIKIVLLVAEDFEIVVKGEEFTEEKCKEAVDIVIKALKQDPKTGHWIEYDHGLNVKYYQCSICKGFDGGEKGKYCKWCGAKMVEP